MIAGLAGLAVAERDCARARGRRPKPVPKVKISQGATRKRTQYKIKTRTFGNSRRRIAIHVVHHVQFVVFRSRFGAMRRRAVTRCRRRCAPRLARTRRRHGTCCRASRCRAFGGTNGSSGCSRHLARHGCARPGGTRAPCKRQLELGDQQGYKIVTVTQKSMAFIPFTSGSRPGRHEKCASPVCAPRRGHLALPRAAAAPGGSTNSVTMHVQIPPHFFPTPAPPSQT